MHWENDTHCGAYLVGQFMCINSALHGCTAHFSVLKAAGGGQHLFLMKASQKEFPSKPLNVR
jgi:hypothetical protein